MSCLEGITLQTSNVCPKLDDLQSMLQIYRSTTVTKAPFLLPADVAHFSQHCTGDASAWTSLFAMGICNNTKALLGCLTGRTPHWCLDIAHLRLKGGGVGILDPTTNSLPQPLSP